MDKMQLSDDPKKALTEIAGYIRTVRVDAARTVRNNKGEAEGFWQTDDWSAGLLEIADECDRISSLPNAPAHAQAAGSVEPVVG